ncbi:MAG: hypothetical protein ACI8QC_001705 [Planctomycetota bacterium]|jgi:hypothetical protein
MNEHLNNCADVRASLPLWVGADLEVTDAALVVAHLDRCADCRDAADRAEDARQALVERLEVEVDGPVPDLWAGVRAGLVESGQIAAPVLAGPGFWASRMAVGGFAAAAALVLMLGMSGRLGGSPERAGADAAGLANASNVAEVALPDTELVPMVTRPVSASRPLRRAGLASPVLLDNADDVHIEVLQRLRGEQAPEKDSGLVLTGGN